jgi:hypothetical protein
MERNDGPRPAALVGAVLAFAALGTPLFLYVWETVNGLLSGHCTPGRLALAVVALALLALLLRVLARLLERWAPVS